MSAIDANNDASESVTAELRAKFGKRTATIAHVCDAVDIVMDLFDSMNEKNVARNARLAALEQEVAALKTRPLLKWAGTHTVGAEYAEASLVTRSGGLWVSTTKTSTTPGEGSHWRLVVKRGAHDDAR